MQVEPGKLLVVDDNRLNRLKLSRGLELQGHRVVLAEHGMEALALLASEAVDLVLLDIMMPEMDGFQVLERMKADADLRDLPVIVISALDEMESIVRCIQMGAEDYLLKPFDPVLLRARINACLEKKRLRDAVVQQLDFIREIFGKYVPKDIAATLIENRGQLAPKRTVATVLYSDIESFTSTAERIPPEQLFQMLNEYFPAVVEPITRHGGVVNQFIGDAILATFNIPMEDEQHADHAVQAAMEIQQALHQRRFAGLPVRTRIGINTGPVIAGNVGSGERFSYTVYGDAVNVAARLEQLNKAHDSLVLVSGFTRDRLLGSFPLSGIGETAIRGKAEAVPLYRLDWQPEP